MSKKKVRVLSLFDGSGCWQLAGELVGFEAKYASEIEKFPIEVTKKNFPNMIHLGMSDREIFEHYGGEDDRKGNAAA